MSPAHLIAAAALGAFAVAVFLWRREAGRLRAQIEAARAKMTTVQDDHARAAAQARAEQQTLFNSMVEGVLVLDDKGRIRLANQTIERLFGVTADIRGKTVLEAFRLHELQELVNRAFIESHVVGAEIELPVLEKLCLQVNAALFLDPAGRRQGVVLVFHDLTRIRQLESTRQEFVANVSHELRTPLSLIKGYCETLIDGAKDDPAVALRFLQTIEKHADRLTFLIEDLLTISRLESGQIVLNVQPVELAPLVQHLLDERQERVKDKNVTVRNEVPAELFVRADTDRLEQVLLNLVDNAIKYGGSSVSVTVGARMAGEGLVEIHVADNGPGIAPEHRERIFERFYRVDRARSRDQGGTGLGLAIVKHIVQSHGGEVWVKSEPGQGSTFYFTLPLAPQDT
jgi:two-component system, OmpR family, phosphate regulon sensor histidine kinase PhoR